MHKGGNLPPIPPTSEQGIGNGTDCQKCDARNHLLCRCSGTVVLFYGADDIGSFLRPRPSIHPSMIRIAFVVFHPSTPAHQPLGTVPLSMSSGNWGVVPNSCHSAGTGGVRSAHDFPDLSFSLVTSETPENDRHC